MATTHRITFTHTCDLCGAERAEAEMQHLHGVQSAPQHLGQGPRVDICADCTARPVSEVLAFLASTAGKSHRTVRFVERKGA